MKRGRRNEVAIDRTPALCRTLHEIDIRSTVVSREITILFRIAVENKEKNKNKVKKSKEREKKKK